MIYRNYLMITLICTISIEVEEYICTEKMFNIKSVTELFYN